MARNIIVLSTGRCGTAKLAEILCCLPNVIATHEALPYHRQRSAPMYHNASDLRHELSMQDMHVYCDTSYAVMFGFVEHYLLAGVVPDAIVLCRDVELVALSYYQLGSIPGKPLHDGEEMHEVNPYMFTPGEHGSESLYGLWDELTDLEKCIWFAREMVKRREFYAESLENAGAHVVRLWTESLNDLSEVNRAMRHLGLGELKKLPEGVVNAKTEMKIPGR